MTIPHDLQVIGKCRYCREVLSESVDNPDNLLSNVSLQYDIICKTCESWLESEGELDYYVSTYYNRKVR